MPLTQLDHVNIRTAHIDELCAFYVEILGLTQGPRPDFSFDGVWLYLGSRACVHLVEVSPAPQPGADLRMEHVAFSATGYHEFIAHLDNRGVSYRLGRLDVPRPDGSSISITQVNLHDPDDNHVHVDFET